MLECDRIDISDGIDVNKTNASKECNICYYWYSGTPTSPIPTIKHRRVVRIGK